MAIMSPPTISPALQEIIDDIKVRQSIDHVRMHEMIRVEVNRLRTDHHELSMKYMATMLVSTLAAILSVVSIFI